MTESLLKTEALKKITGYERPGDIERCLKKQGIRFFYGKNGPWTTLELVNAAGGLIFSPNLNRSLSSQDIL